MVAGGWEGEEMGAAVPWYRVSVTQDEKVLETYSTTMSI